MNLLKIISEFKTQQDCINHLEAVKWNGVPKCPYCGSTNTNPLVKEARHHCNGCRKSFSITVGTIFHHTHIELQKWFLLISLMMNAKKSLSACQASRDLGMRRTTIWKMMHKIREALKSGNKDLLGGVVEMDETYVKTNTKSKNDDIDDDLPPFDFLKRGRGSQNNTAVVGIKEKDGDVKAIVVNDVKYDTLVKFAKDSVDIGSEMHTDQFRAYHKFSKFFNHKTVNHAKQYVNFEGTTTNGIEGFWSLLKRGIKGQFHHISKFYLQKYVDEFCYRYNMREMSESFIFGDVLKKMLFI